MKNVLVAKTGALEGSVYTIAGRTLIGRGEECDIRLAGGGVSRKHACVLELDDGSVIVRDLKSRSGTLVRGQRLVEAELSQGDELVVGDIRFELRSVSDELDQTLEIDLRGVGGPSQAITSCCDSPLAQVARKGAWSFCPGCGASTTS